MGTTFLFSEFDPRVITSRTAKVRAEKILRFDYHRERYVHHLPLFQRQQMRDLNLSDQSTSRDLTETRIFPRTCPAVTCVTDRTQDHRRQG
jgi:hypothetical protein